MTNLRKLLFLVLSGRYRTLVETIRLWWRSDAIGVGLGYDLAVPLAARLPRAKLSVRPLRQADVSSFTETAADDVAGEDILVRVNARHLIESGIETCYVAVTDDGPAYMQYLITPDQNDRVHEVFGGLFPELEPGEALLEFAFTLERYRSTAVMPTALVTLLDIARERRLQRVITYVSASHASFIRFYLFLGFQPFAIRHEKRRFFRRSITFEALSVEAAEERLRALGLGPIPARIAPPPPPSDRATGAHEEAPVRKDAVRPDASVRTR